MPEVLEIKSLIRKREAQSAYRFCGVDDDNDRLDFLANGFKHRSTSGGYNSDNRFVYYAFAESPFVNSNGVPNNAR